MIIQSKNQSVEFWKTFPKRITGLNVIMFALGAKVLYACATESKEKCTCGVHHICLSACGNPRTAERIFIKYGIMKAKVYRVSYERRYTCT
jgi:hypothetical protein